MGVASVDGGIWESGLDKPFPSIVDPAVSRSVEQPVELNWNWTPQAVLGGLGGLVLIAALSNKVPIPGDPQSFAYEATRVTMGFIGGMTLCLAEAKSWVDMVSGFDQTGSYKE